MSYHLHLHLPWLKTQRLKAQQRSRSTINSIKEAKCQSSKLNHDAITRNKKYKKQEAKQEASRVASWRVRVAWGARCELLCDVHVGEADVAGLVNEDVLRFDVAVQHAVLVQVCKGYAEKEGMHA